jgi:hypothetical protein
MSQRVARTGGRAKNNNNLIALAWLGQLVALIVFLIFKEKSIWPYLAAAAVATALLFFVHKASLRSSRFLTLAWVFNLGILIIALLYKERSDLLYALATVGLTLLLAIVALADLHGGRKGVDEEALGDDSAALASGIPATLPPTSAAPSDWRGSSKAKRKTS